MGGSMQDRRQPYRPLGEIDNPGAAPNMGRQLGAQGLVNASLGGQPVGGRVPGITDIVGAVGQQQPQPGLGNVRPNLGAPPDMSRGGGNPFQGRFPGMGASPYGPPPPPSPWGGGMIDGMLSLPGGGFGYAPPWFAPGFQQYQQQQSPYGGGSYAGGASDPRQMAQMAAMQAMGLGNFPQQFAAAPAMQQQMMGGQGMAALLQQLLSASQGQQRPMWM